MQYKIERGLFSQTPYLVVSEGECVKREGVKREDVKREDVKREDVKRESVKREDVRESVKREGEGQRATETTRIC